MRDPKQGGSQAPRNSRELAIRNQFFTPRYVVQFLTDNTLGRIWYEMRGTKTALAEQCEYMVRKPGEEFAPRPKKDPRDLRVLDPACGSGHFLLYAFDLLLTIYEEAYADPESPTSEATGGDASPPTTRASTRFGRPSLASSSRTTSTASTSIRAARRSPSSLSGCARSGRTATSASVAPSVADPPLQHRCGRAARRGRSHRRRVRCADSAIRSSDASSQVSLDQLKLAGDLGILLRIESRDQAQTRLSGQMDLFAPPEERIRAALARFVAQKRRAERAYDAASSPTTPRRVWGSSAIAEKRFDVVLMNPPFGAGSTRAKNDFEKAYPQHEERRLRGVRRARNRTARPRTAVSARSRRGAGSSFPASRNGAKTSCCNTPRL